MKIQIDVLEKPLSRIQEICTLLGANDTFERALPELETYLEKEVAGGETRETVLTDVGFRFLQSKLQTKPDGS